MFVLIECFDVVYVSSNASATVVETDIISEIRNRYVGRQLPDNLGSIVDVWDVLDHGALVTIPHDGSFYYSHVRFRVVVFRPFVGQVFDCRVIASDETGLSLTIDSHENIRVLPDDLPDYCIYDSCDGQWSWISDEEELPLRIGQTLRVRVKICINGVVYATIRDPGLGFIVNATT
jgi:DNA-directed RNA polymerase III subunit RPC8